MATPVTEMFNGGVVTSRHAALLRPGELQRADDCVYRANDPAIWRAPGRTQYGTVVASSPTLGLAYLPFENKYLPKIMAYSGTTLYSLPVVDSGSETSTEVGGPRVVIGDCATVSGHTDFTANDGEKPFLASVVGSRVFSTQLNGTSINNVVVSAVSGTPTNGHYPTVTIKKTDGTAITSTFGTTVDLAIAFQWGIVQVLDQSTTARLNTLDVSQYGNAYFGWFGFGEPRKIEYLTPPVIAGVGSNPVLSQRPLGLAPVTDPITAVAITGAVGSSSDTYAWRAILGTGYFWFLVTEIYVVQTQGDDGKVRDVPGTEIESAYLAPGGTSNTPGEPVPVSVPNATTGVRIVLPAVKNVGIGGRIATHWGIYMAPIPTVAPDSRPSLATFRRIGRPAIKTFAAGTNAYGDAGTYEVFELVASQTLYATSSAAMTGGIAWTNPNGFLGAPQGVQDTNPQNFARGSSRDTDGDGAVTPTSKLSYTIAAGAPWATRDVTGITVRIVGRANSSGNNQTHSDAYVYLTNGAGKDSPSRYMSFTNSTVVQYKIFGGQGDTWGVTWGNFAALSTFGVVMGVGASDANMTTWIDSVQIILYGSSATIDINGKPYRCVVYRDQIGTTIAEPAYGLPPSCSTATFFQGMFVTNDLDDDTAIRYSLPGYPEYFPRPYVMRLNAAKRRDKVTALFSLGQVLVAGLENSIERVNYLPREVNTDLEDGLAHEELTCDHGISGPLAAVKFDLPGGGTMLAYASNAGVFLTDGITVRPLNMDLDWPNMVKVSALSSCVFRVYSKEKWLILYYCPAGASHDRNTRALVFSYAADKIKEGGFLPCTGPISVSARSSCEAIISGAARILTGHETSGLIYNEDIGVTQATGYQVHNGSDSLVSAPILPVVKTRKFYPSGFDRDGYGEKVYLLFSSYGSNSVTASSTTVINTTTVTSSAAFGSVVAGMRILGTGIEPGTIVLSKSDSSTIVISRAANVSGTATLTFDTGTLGIGIRGSNLGESVKGLSIDYVSTLVGDLVSCVRSNIRRGFEVQIEKVPLTFDANGDTLTSADLSVNMRLHSLTFMLEDGGPDANRNAA
jgi:hypothetical protein